MRRVRAVLARKADEREETLETRSREAIEELGGALIKLYGYRGIPDRLALLDGRCAFVEFKRRRGGRIEPMQTDWNAFLKGMRFKAFFVRTDYQFAAVLKWLKSGSLPHTRSSRRSS